MRYAVWASATVVGLLSAAPAVAASERVAVADFDFSDTSGEVKDQSAFHTAQIKQLQQTIATALNTAGRFEAVGLACDAPPCSVDNLAASTLTGAAKTAGASLLVFGGVHKISTLITFGRVSVADVASGKSVLDSDVTFRGDDADAWQHADSYIADMVVQAITKAHAGK
jgi:hypothetical protein